MLLTSDNPSYNLPGLNIKIPEKPLNRQKLDKDSRLFYGVLKQTLTHMLDIQDIKFSGIAMGTKELHDT